MPEPTTSVRSQTDAAELEATIDEAIASCDGDVRAAVRALLLALGVYELEVATLREDIARVRAAVSPGYVRGRLGRQQQDEGSTT